LNPTNHFSTFTQAFRWQFQKVFGNWRFVIHLILWVVLIWGAVALVTPSELKLLGKSTDVNTYLNFRKIKNFIFIFGITYSYLLIVIPYTLLKTKKWVIVAGVLLVILFWFMFNFGSMYALFSIYPSALVLVKGSLFHYILIKSINIFQIIWLFFACYYFIDLYHQQNQLNKYSTILSEKIEVEKVFLKNQINPHFLFNTLNNMYALSIQKSDDAVVIAKQLKQLLQYMMYDCANDKVTLQGELHFIENYIGLEKIRNKSSNLDIQVNINTPILDYEIAPLLLINFVENAFKHGVKSTTQKSYVKLNVSVLNNQLLFDVSNSIDADAQLNDLADSTIGGIGLQNVKRRLAILYPNKHSLKLGKSETQYNVYLMIQL
jgi:two-component system, LytTR family, sensor kinase